MFKLREYNKTRSMPIGKAECENLVEGTVLVLDEGKLRKATSSDTITADNAFTYYFCNERKMNTVDKDAAVQYVGAVPFGELYYGTIDLAFDAQCGAGITFKAGAFKTAVATEYVFAGIEKDNGWVSGDAKETKFSTYGCGYTKA